MLIETYEPTINYSSEEREKELLFKVVLLKRKIARLEMMIYLLRKGF